MMPMRLFIIFPPGSSRCVRHEYIPAVPGQEEPFMGRPPGEKVRLSGLPMESLQEWLVGAMSMRSYRAGQLFRWIHLRRVASFEEMTDIAVSARRAFAETAALTAPTPSATLRAEDGTVKQTLGLEDGAVVESVLIPDPPRLTACLSTQAGCRMGCAFCATGRMGLARNLGADEIVAQLYSLAGLAGEDRITNVVLMGMGEPMDNFRPVSDALSIISDDRGICIGSRKITVSTVGLPGGIDRLAALPGQYGLAVSLHSAVEATRRRLVPASTALPLTTLRKDMQRYAEDKGRRVTLEVCLIAGVNDSLREADALAVFTRDLPCKINILLYNRVPGLGFERPDDEAVKRFMEYLYPRCPAVTLRRSRGAAIAAACGQLAASPRPPAVIPL
jgi:23S rRNA (adenine2503-C2)-methyltransferase